MMDITLTMDITLKRTSALCSLFNAESVLSSGGSAVRKKFYRSRSPKSASISASLTSSSAR